MASRKKIVSSTGFTDDILTEIFIHLLLRSIHRFKCLSKVWLSNFSNPDFIKKWFHINKKSLPWIQYHSMTNQGDNESPLRFRKAYHQSHSEFMCANEHLFTFKFLMNQKPLKGSRLFLLGSSKGLVRCWSTIGGYHVCNPLSQKWVSLPSPPGSRGSPSDVNGIFCEYSSPFESSYKVVWIKEVYTPPKKFNVNVFSSDLGAWQRYEVLCDKEVIWKEIDWSRSRFDNAVILNGVLYWIDVEARMFAYNINQNYQSGGHRCSLINLPDEEFGGHATEYDSFLGESEGLACYARIRITGKELTLSAWVLDELNWDVLCKDISVENILAELSTRLGKAAGIQVIQVLGFSPVDRNVVLFGYLHWIWVFNIQTGSVEELCLDNKQKDDLGVMNLPFMLKPMPTVLPPPSWT